MIQRIFFSFVIFLLCISSLSAKTEKYGTWFEFELTKKLFKKFEVSLIPDIRLQDDFTVDKYQIDGKLAYEPVKFLEFAAAYRYRTNVKENGNEFTHRYIFDATAKKEIERFTASLRGRYVTFNNYDSNDRTQIIRGRAKLVYNIKGNKITPYTRYELFKVLGESQLQKGRFDIGFLRKIGKLHRIGIYYRNQHYFVDRPTIHILGIDYRLKI